MLNINDAKNYKPCRKKIYEIYVCKPPIGTCVINKLEQADIVRQCNGRTFFTADEMQKMSMTNPQMFNYLRQNAYVVDVNKRYILSGVLGEMWAIDEVKLCERYQLSDGTLLTPQALLHRCYYSAKVEKNGVISFEPTTQTLEAHVKENNSNMQEDCILSVMGWHKVRTKPEASNTFAMFIPKNEKIQIRSSWGSIETTNLQGLNHGKGDFLVCNALPNGTPDVQRLRVVNGVVFSATYNNQGWQDCIDSKSIIDSTNLPKPKELFSSIETKIKSNSEKYFEKFISWLKHISGGRYKFFKKAPEWKLSTIDNLQSIRFLINNFKGEVSFSNTALELYGNCSSRLDLESAPDHIGKAPADDAGFDRLIGLISNLSSIFSFGFESNFKHPLLSQEFNNALREYTGSVYDKINTAMRDNDLSRLPLHTYVHTVNIYKYLNSCHLSCKYLFRGFDIDISVGSRISCNCFSSLSIDLATSLRFGKNVVCFNDCTNLPACYIDNISHFRQSEFEVLLNAGYTIEVTKKLCQINDKQLWKAELVKNDFKLNDALASYNEIDKQVLNLISTTDLVDYIYLTQGYDNFYIKSYSNAIKLSCEYITEKNILVVRSMATKEVNELKFDDTFNSKLYAFLHNLIIVKYKALKGTPLYIYGARLISNLVNLFSNEGFIIINQDFSEQDVVEKTFSGRLTISGDNDDNIVLFVRVSNDVISVRAKSNNKKISKDFDVNTRGLETNIFEAVCNYFKLNQFGRILKAFRLACSYKKIPFNNSYCNKVSSTSMTVNLSIGDFYINLDGNTIDISNNRGMFKKFSYTDNLITIASEIAKSIGGND